MTPSEDDAYKAELQRYNASYTAYFNYGLHIDLTFVAINMIQYILIFNYPLVWFLKFSGLSLIVGLLIANGYILFGNLKTIQCILEKQELGERQALKIVFWIRNLGTILVFILLGSLQ